ncbi:MAG: enoyl-CoA hydratase-related protein [Deltaproteobacteria bacterium]|nr:enoyl-CoA hydratase-related protein [Deltaproteobacteria bacterium]
MSYQTIILRQEDSLAELHFNRPESYNALDSVMARELNDALEKVAGDDSCRALLVTGTGPAFHAGGDVKSFHDAAAGEGTARFIERLVGGFHDAVTRLVRLPKPTVAAVNGVAAGAGFSLAMGCDLVLACEEALFTCAYSRIGVSPDGSLSYHLPRLVGYHRAMELYLENRVLSAGEALEWGLVNRVLPAANFLETARQQARALAEGPTAAFARAKELFLGSLFHGLEEQLELEARGIVDSAGTDDSREGIKAFMEKRPPVFKGR